MNVTALLPYLFILICPLMMLFMMRGMHGKRSDNTRSDNTHGPGAFDEQGTLRQGQSLTLLTGERDRLEGQLAELDAEIDAKGPQIDQSHESRVQKAQLSR